MSGPQWRRILQFFDARTSGKGGVSQIVLPTPADTQVRSRRFPGTERSHTISCLSEKSPYCSGHTWRIVERVASFQPIANLRRWGSTDALKFNPNQGCRRCCLLSLCHFLAWPRQICRLDLASSDRGHLQSAIPPHCHLDSAAQSNSFYPNGFLLFR